MMAIPYLESIVVILFLLATSLQPTRPSYIFSQILLKQGLDSKLNIIHQVNPPFLEIRSRRFHIKYFSKTLDCTNGILVGNGICNIETNNSVCSYDGGDCLGSDLSSK